MEIVAEIGINHDGDLERAKTLISLAKDAGANTVKFQLYSVNELLNNKAVSAAPYQAKALGEFNQNDFLKKCQFGRDEVFQLKEFSDDVGIGFLCTAYSITDMNILAELGERRVKLPSISIYEPQSIALALSIFDQVIVSTGFSTTSDLETLRDTGNLLEINWGRLTICHCVSAYPTELGEVNLAQLLTIKEIFPEATMGVSDHTPSNLVAVMAYSQGVKFCEKHFTDDKNRWGADHAMSLDPGEFSQFSHSILDATLIWGHRRKIERTHSEKANFLVMSRSPHVKKPFVRGESLALTDIAFSRPNVGVTGLDLGPPPYVLSRDINAGEIIRPEDLQSLLDPNNESPIGR